MLSLLQILLKILGIILLSILGILFVLLLVVLLVPVRYGAKGSYKEEFICHGKVTWLFHLVSVSVDYEKQLHTKIKILGIPLSAFQKKTAKKKTEEVIKKTVDETSEIVADTVDDNKLTDKETPDVKEPVSKNKTQSTTKSVATESEIQEKKSFVQRIKGKIKETIDKIHVIWNSICNILRSVKVKKDNIMHYISILQREEVKKAFSLCKKRLWIMIKHILPKKMRIEAEFGFDDPATTGYILAIHGMLPVSVGKKIVLHPDFEHSLFVCNFKLKGAVNAWSLLHQLLCIISDKNCRALYQIVKKEILNERK